MRPIGLLYSIWSILAATSIVAASDKGRKRTPTKEEACTYLRADHTQYNSYFTSDFKSDFCCFCPQGTSFAGDCDPSRPRSTQCIPCPDGFHVDFEPHLEGKCHRKRRRHCRSPKVYDPGTKTKADSCVCPHGTTEDEKTKDCKTVRDIISSTTSTEPASLLKRLMKPLPKTHTSTSPTTKIPAAATRTNDLPSTTADYSSSKPTTEIIQRNNIATSYVSSSSSAKSTLLVTIESSGLTSSTNSSFLNDGSWIWVVLALGGGGGGLIFGIRKWKKKKVSEKSQSSNTSVCESTSTVAESPPVANKSSRTTVNYDNGPRSQTTPLLLSLQDPETTPTETRVVHDQSETSRQYLAIPIGVHSISQEHYEEFAKEVALKLGRVCDVDGVLPLFRQIIKDVNDNELNDIVRECRKTSEKVYQCMLLAIRQHGNELSPSYLWDKINGLGYNQYTDIVNAVIRQFLQFQDENKHNILSSTSAL